MDTSFDLLSSADLAKLIGRAITQERLWVGLDGTWTAPKVVVQNERVVLLVDLLNDEEQ